MLAAAGRPAAAINVLFFRHRQHRVLCFLPYEGRLRSGAQAAPPSDAEATRLHPALRRLDLAPRPCLHPALRPARVSAPCFRWLRLDPDWIWSAPHVKAYSTTPPGTTSTEAARWNSRNLRWNHGEEMKRHQILQAREVRTRAPGSQRTASTAMGQTFNFLSALGDVAFAYAGHNVDLEIQATIPSTPEKPSKKPMWLGVLVAYLVVAICYLPVAFVGYYVFGNAVDDNILITLEKPRWLIAAANLFVVVHVIGSYQIYAMPVFDMLETFLVKKLRFTPGLPLRLMARTLYVVLTALVGIAIPFFGGLLGFFGGFAFAPTTYYLPCILWLKIKKPKAFSLSWFTNWFCIIVGVLLTVFAPIGGLRSIIVNASTYKFFS